MITSIPDKIFKLFILIGILLIGYAYLKSNESYDTYLYKFSKYEKAIDSLAIVDEYKAFNEEKFERMSKAFELKHGVDSVCFDDGDDLVFSRIITKDNNLVHDLDYLELQWSKIKEFELQQKILNLKIESFKEKHKVYKNDLSFWTSEYNAMHYIGAFLLVLGLFLWFIDSYLKKEHQKQNEIIYERCQSCYEGFSSMRTYGLNRDKTFNMAFCKDCYNNGEFIEPEITMNDTYKKYIKKNKIKGKLFKYLVYKRIESLDRWQY